MITVETNIVLTEHEMRICTWLAKSRHAVARAADVVDAQMGPQGSWQTDLDGIAGEFAFCKAMNCYPDMTVSARSGGTDARVGSITVDVKATRYEDGRLLATRKKAAFACDRFVLVVGTPPNLRVAGWCHADELLDSSNIINLGHGEGYGLNQVDLRSMHTW